MKHLLPFLLAAAACTVVAKENFQLTPSGYFRAHGIDVMAFDDIYPEGHQGGVCLIMNGHRVATNGDLRLEATPGQWQPLPKQLSRELGEGSITATLCYPDSSRHLVGFNPTLYPELQLRYKVNVVAKGEQIEVTVDLEQPIPESLIGKVGFNLEFFPGSLFGRPWIMDETTGIYPQQPNGPLTQTRPNHLLAGDYKPAGTPRADLNRYLGEDKRPLAYSPLSADEIIGEPYAVGHRFTSRPDDPMSRVTIQSKGGTLKLYDGRINHNNGWFVLREEVRPGTTSGAIRWIISPTITESWQYTPVIQTSQVGYHPAQPKVVTIETMGAKPGDSEATLVRLTADGEQTVRQLPLRAWGHFLRYDYLQADFSDVSQPGLYRIDYSGQQSPVFRIDPDVYDRGVWQPVLEYFLPVQMCHMRVAEKYRVWHDACHMDDALMAQPGVLFDGYLQAEDADLFPYQPGQKVPGVNVGGWHDAGDFDLRIESQAGEAYILALAYEAFHPEIDVTSIDQQRHVTEIHQPDGRNDLLQQVENGALTVVRGYQALGRLYRGIICNSLRQYVLLGDASAMTDGVAGNADDRWIYTEHNPSRELSTATDLAAAARVLRGFNDELSRQCLDIARKVYEETRLPEPSAPGYRQLLAGHLAAAAELYLATDERPFLDEILAQQKTICANIDQVAWQLARIEQRCAAMPRDKKAKTFSTAFRKALVPYAERIAQQAAETPYGIPYRPHIWGAGWDIQRFGFQNYYLAKAYPELFPKETVFNALNFILGCHPGSNQASFAGGVGAQSATVGYGLNRADWSYIPGGVISGTALIRPDFPELLTFPFLWQQTEYVLGGGSSHYMFLVLAAQELLK